ncbi:MAG: Double zinc ribbon [Thermoleophilia bacterium]|nr:Double zinc ribbon [Thermoleophilia bacterium]
MVGVWTIGDDEPPGEAPRAVTRPDCPGCGAPDLAGDDFCHECGHSFSHFSSADDIVEEVEHGVRCPICGAGELVTLEYGRTQCESCGYTARDVG